jgi:hypothetical protein
VPGASATRTPRYDAIVVTGRGSGSTKGEVDAERAAAGLNGRLRDRPCRRTIPAVRRGLVTTNSVFRRCKAVAVGFEPTVDFHPHTLSSSANPRSGTVVGVRLVLTKTSRDAP